jgi:hypothetical protein
VDYTIARSALAVPSRVCVAARLVCATREVLSSMKAPLRRGFRLRNGVFWVNLYAFGA